MIPTTGMHTIAVTTGVHVSYHMPKRTSPCRVSVGFPWLCRSITPFPGVTSCPLVDGYRL